MENNTGWIKLHRIIMDHPDWLAEPFTRAQAWVDLLLLANHKVGHIRKRGILIEVQRGSGHGIRSGDFWPVWRQLVKPHGNQYNKIRV
jgi:hypothetical protein